MMDRQMSEKEQVRQISEKLRREYQMDLARFDTTTIENLRIVCLRVEAGIAAAGTVASYPRPQQARMSPPRSEQQQPRFRARGNYSRPRFSGPVRRRSNYAPRPGNYSQRPNNYSGRQGNYQPRQMQGAAKPVVTCYRCDRKGHYANDCRALTKLDGNPIERKSITPKRVAMVNEHHGQDTETRVLTIKRCQQIVKLNNYVSEPKDQLMKYPIVCNGVEIMATIDTGSQVTVIDEKRVRQNNWNTLNSSIPPSLLTRPPANVYCT